MNHKKFHKDGFINASGGGHHNAGGGGHGHGGGRDGYYGGYRGGYGIGYTHPYPYVFIDQTTNPEELADNQVPVAVNAVQPTVQAPATQAAAAPVVVPSVASGIVGGDSSPIQPAPTGMKTQTATLLVGAAIASVLIFGVLKLKKII